jgi:hypothetical protein
MENSDAWRNGRIDRSMEEWMDSRPGEINKAVFLPSKVYDGMDGLLLWLQGA